MGGRYVVISFLFTYTANAGQTVLREIEEEELKWQEKEDTPSIGKNTTKT
jgi:hypothetical protein